MSKITKAAQKIAASYNEAACKPSCQGYTLWFALDGRGEEELMTADTSAPPDVLVLLVTRRRMTAAEAQRMLDVAVEG